MTSDPQNLEAQETQQLTADDSNETPPSEIVAYNELRSCADLYRMYNENALEIQPEFQRDIVWKPTDQTRFIDSLVKQLPIPSMCFALDNRQQKWIVIDGLQRMFTIIRFLSDSTWRLSRLEDIDSQLAGKNVSEMRNLNSSLHSYYTRVQNLTIPITVLRCDLMKKSHNEYLFTIFHRLNTGGMKLNNQEIRNCIYIGPFNDLLKELDGVHEWRRLNRMSPNNNYRFTKQEIILRFFTFLDALEKYDGRLSKFMNDYMHKYRYAKTEWLDQKEELFRNTVHIIYVGVFDGRPPSKLSLTVLEALLVGVGANAPALMERDGGSLRHCYDELIGHDELNEPLIREGLSKKPRVQNRLAASIEIFAKA